MWHRRRPSIRSTSAPTTSTPGRAWRAARPITLVTKSGTNSLQGLGLLLPQSGRAERAAVLRSVEARFEHHDRRRHGRRSDQEEQAVLLRARAKATTSATAVSTRYTVPTARMRNGDFSEVLAIAPTFRLFDPATGNADGTGRTEFAGRGDSVRIASAVFRRRSRRSILRRTIRAPTTACRTICSCPARRRRIATTTT